VSGSSDRSAAGSDDLVEAAAQHLTAVLAVDDAGADEFVGRGPEQAFDRIYGGQLSAQALLAASRTVGDRMRPISAHTNFLRLGATHERVRYAVERAADGRSYSTRVVHAFQRDRLLSVSIVSFQDTSTEHARIDHDPNFSAAPGPSTLVTRDDSMVEHFGDRVTSTMAMSSWPIDVRYVDRTPWTPQPTEARNRMWMRTRAPLPDDETTQCAALLYAADLHLPEPILYPSQLSWYELVNGAGVFGATLDYTLWFHRPFRFDDWLLHEQESPAVANSRGLTTGRFWAPDGSLVASASELVGVLAAEGR
jgi:acyl-CoA thioesterase-2